VKNVMLIDVALCHDCNNCFMACKDEHCGNVAAGAPQQPKHGHRWMNILRRERGQYPMIDMAFLPMPCQQCEHPACAAACPGIGRRSDGIVTVDDDAAKGCRAAAEACPLGAMYYNEELGIPQKCDFCRHLLDQGAEVPRCVEVCPTGALSFRQVDEAGYAALRQEGWEPYGIAGDNSVLYRHLARFTRHFLGGSVIRNDDCVEGARVTLLHGGKKLAEAITNEFGDFKFDGLEPGAYTVTIAADGAEKTLEAEIDDARSLGVIRLG